MPLPTPPPFHPADLSQSIIAMPLRQELQDAEKYPPGHRFPVIIDLNLEYPGGRAGAMRWVVAQLNDLVQASQPENVPYGQDADQLLKNQHSQQYLFVQLEREAIRGLVQRDVAQARQLLAQARPASPPGGAAATAAPPALPARPRAIHHIWSDFELTPHLNRSAATIKADAARAAYSAYGADIVWAVMDSGIDHTHPHFATHQTLALTLPLVHTDFTDPLARAAAPDAPPLAAYPDLATLTALTDPLGHGTHVAGIIAGEWDEAGGTPRAFNSQRDEAGIVTDVPVTASRLSGIASRTSLLSLKVLDEHGAGNASSLIAAINKVQELNGYGRHLLVHGVNMSLGYEFDPQWFACGQSPLCVEVDRLVRSGVVVVVAAGNTGYGTLQTYREGIKASGLGLTINDPGNAELAITVGATHRDMPHVYGVSFFSSKGPTGDGRAKPDLLAPGERILSCAAGAKRTDPEADEGQQVRDYVEDSGTSMAAPHVSGAIAAFLSIRREYIGRPEQVKAIFMDSATDLKRDKYFQGSGLVDLMRAIQSV